MVSRSRNTTDSATTEEVVLLDEKGNVIGAAEKSTVHTTHTLLHLAFSAYVFDEAGELLMTRRALTKQTWPGVWTNSCCGHPGPGEAMHAAIRRRLKGELGLIPHAIDLVLPTFRYRAEMPDGIVENEMCPVYRVMADGPEDLNPADVHEARWIAWGRLMRTTNRRGPGDLSPWCQEQLEHLSALGPTPADWPVADPQALPAAARRP